MTTLTVGEIRKAIANLPDDSEVHLDLATKEMADEDRLSELGLTPERAYHDVLNGILVIDACEHD